jgi:mono/diheme cytochrome c family protein
MKTNVAIFAMMGALAATASYSTLGAQQATTRSVLDGVYTEEQAKRGEALYAQACAVCHGVEGKGDLGPPITATDLVAVWKTSTLGDLFEKIMITMPADEPGKLNAQQMADVLAYMLRFAKFPVGTTELGSEVEPMKQIRIEAPMP